jgi:hypothetical protein
MDDDIKDDLITRRDMKAHKTTRARIEFLESLSLNLSSSKKLTEGARCWVRDTYNPVINCLRNHCDGNVDTFCERWGSKVAMSKFTKLCAKNSSCLIGENSITETIGENSISE